MKEDSVMIDLTGKHVAVIGDRDGIPGPAIEECIKKAGGTVVFSTTECFVWTAAGAMDMENQTRILELVEKYGKDSVVVVLGGAEAEASGLAAETVTTGDPTFAGPLTGVQLELPVYHIFELKEIIPEDVWEDQISMMEMVLDVDEIVKEVTTYRERNGG